MITGFFTSSVERVLSWARAQSLAYISAGGACCADELLNTLGCRYDLERFGCVEKSEANQADLLIITGSISKKAAPAVKALYDSMLAPKYVMALGTCANCGGLFAGEEDSILVKGVSELLPVDVYVTGCPPRPEAIMDGIITLQEKIRGRRAPKS